MTNTQTEKESVPNPDGNENLCFILKGYIWE